MTELEFQSLANAGYNRIPLIAEALADLETPLSLYLKLAQPERNGANSFLLESVVGGERFGRYSFIGLPARTLVRAIGTHCEVVRDGTVIETHDGDPLEFIQSYQSRFKVAQRPGLPRFSGGLAGYFGYDAVRFIEKKLANTFPPHLFAGQRDRKRRQPHSSHHSRLENLLASGERDASRVRQAGLPERGTQGEGKHRGR